MPRKGKPWLPAMHLLNKIVLLINGGLNTLVYLIISIFCYLSNACFIRSSSSLN